jgi:molybdenum cofactor biosynthesis enzyme MoaA
MFLRKKHIIKKSEFNSGHLKKYNKTRSASNRELFCYAPFKNIYFNINGDAAPCWQSFINPDSYPSKSISQIWNGGNFEEIRRGIKEFDLSKKCAVCYDNFLKGNYLNVLARAYDNDYPLSNYPSVLELELGNHCNLECIMCNGKLSSSIAVNREKSINTKSPYDLKFVEQIEEYLPYVREVRINGGEPFLNAINFTICDKLLECNKDVKIVIATNGNALNDKSVSLLEKGRFSINLSVDSLVKENYNKIRVNGDFDKMMQNFNFFNDYCIRKKTTLCILTNPMPQNWHEMPDFIRFCNKYNIPIWFNTIQSPVSCALWALPTDELSHIFKELSQVKFKKNILKSNTYHNLNVYKNLVFHQIYSWLNESKLAKPNDPLKMILSENNLYDCIISIMKKRGMPEKQINEELETIRLKINGIIKKTEEENIDKQKILDVIKNTPVDMLYEQLLIMPDDVIIDQLIKQLKRG